MKIKYEFVTGETVEIEVSDKWGELLTEMDRAENNNDHTETRRHECLDQDMESDWCKDDRPTVSEIVEEHGITENIVAVMADRLTEKQFDAFIIVCISGMTEEEYAKRNGIKQQSVDDRVCGARKKLRKYFSKHPVK